MIIDDHNIWSRIIIIHRGVFFSYNLNRRIWLGETGRPVPFMNFLTVWESIILFWRKRGKGGTRNSLGRHVFRYRLGSQLSLPETKNH